MKREQGFSLVELMIATAITLVLLAATVSSFNDASGLNDRAMAMADLEQNLRAGMNLVVQDFINAGWGIPTGGLPIPSGPGAIPVVRPGPPGTSYTFPSITIASVNPGAALGPVGNGRATDIVNILFADGTLPLNQTPLASIASNGSSVTVNAGTQITGVSNAIRDGDLLAVSNALGSTLEYVTRVDGQIVYFEAGDPLNLNQHNNASQGTILQLKSGGTFPPTTATRVWLVTYYLDTTTDPEMPRLVRRINNRPGKVVALVLEDVQLSYDLADGVTNPTNIKTPTPPNSPNQIRKASLLLTGRSSSVIRNTKDYLRRSLTTQVSLRSLSFIDRYR